MRVILLLLALMCCGCELPRQKTYDELQRDNEALKRAVTVLLNECNEYNPPHSWQVQVRQSYDEIEDENRKLRDVITVISQWMDDTTITEQPLQ